LHLKKGVPGKYPYIKVYGGERESTMKAKFIKNLSIGTPQHIVCYGCSLTAGGAWVDQLRCVLEEKYTNMATVTNSGRGAMWSKWGVDNLEPHVIQKSPDTFPN
jgi:hypothetical protein